MAIKFIEMNRVLDRFHPNKVLSVPVVTLAILVIPLFDTLRVFAIRILQGRSPLSADRNHIHHLLQALGLNHRQTTLSLGTFNILMVVFIYQFQFLKGELLLFLLLLTCVLSSSYVAYVVRKRSVGQVAQSFAASGDDEEHLH